MHHEENIGHQVKKYTLHTFRFCMNIFGEAITKTAAAELLKLETPSKETYSYTGTSERYSHGSNGDAQASPPTASKQPETQQKSRLFAKRRIVIMK